MIVVIDEIAINLDHVVTARWGTYEGKKLLSVEYSDRPRDYFEGQFANKLWTILDVLFEKTMREAQR